MSWIVCGWYTPDYACWWERLRTDLDRLGLAHDFRALLKLDGGWERNTRRKPLEVLDALDRHRGRTVLFLDVDCRITGERADLDALAGIAGDVGLYLRTRWRSTGAPWSGPRSGTLVLRSTPRALALASAWVAETARAPAASVDQDSLAVALGRVPGLSLTTLDVRFCAVPADNCPDPIILHDRASRNSRTGKLKRLLSHVGLAA